jgi:CubicO group peptidase (beta-lactamase class C family)
MTPFSETAESLGYGDLTWDRPAFLARGQISTEQRMPTARLHPAGSTQPLPIGSPLDLAGLAVHDPLLDRTIDMATFLDRRLFNDALLVWHRGAVRHESYRNGIGPHDAHIVHSVSKTLTSMMVGIAQAQGRLSVSDPVGAYVPELAGMPAWQGVTLQHVLDMAVGIATEEHYEDPASMYWRYARAVGYYGPGDAPGIGCLAFVREHLHQRVAEPGSLFNYASYLTNLLPLALSKVYQRPALELYQQYLYARIGAQADCLFNLDPTGLPIVEGHANLTLSDLARWALLYLHDGRNLAGEQIVPQAFVQETLRPDAGRAAAFQRSEAAAVFPGAQYHNKTWLLDPARRRYAMLGIHGQFAYFDRPADLMIVGFGSFPEQTSPLMKACLTRLWRTVTLALGGD